MCIYISQAQLFSGLFTHNVLGAAKMPVVFYLDLVATRIKPQNHRKSLEMRREPRTSGKARKPLRGGRRILEAQAQRGLKCISCDQTPKYSPGTQRQLRGPSRAAELRSPMLPLHIAASRELQPAPFYARSMARRQHNC